MTRVFCASSLAAALTFAAGLDAGLFGERDERRLLLVSNDAAEPELVPGFDESEAVAAVLGRRFDEVVSWNEVVAPLHPAHWRPAAAELPLLSRLVIDHLGLRDGVTELVLDSAGDAPAAAIAALLRDCPITVCTTGLTAYGPGRHAPPAAAATRIGRLVYVDLLPSLQPSFVREYEVGAVPLSPDAVARVVAVLPKPDPREAAGAPVIVGQRLADLANLGGTGLDAADEADLLLRMLRALAARGEECVVFRPDPAAVRTHVAALRAEAARLGVRLVVPDDGLPAEAWFAAARPSLVVSCFSTSLVTAAASYGCDVATMGTDLVLDRLTPYENPLRVAATIAAAALPELRPDGTLVDPAPVDLPGLVAAVGFCMQPNRLPTLRADAVDYLARYGSERYFRKKRVTALNLVPPPELPPQPQPTRGRMGRLLRR